MNTQLNRVWTAAAVGLLAVIGMTGAAAASSPTAAVSAVSGVMTGVLSGVSFDTPDQLIFKDGRIISGKVLEETETQVRFLVVVAGISGEQTYNKADILAIERGEVGDEVEATTTPARGGVDHPDNPIAADTADENAPGVYVLELTGKFGRDIAPTPIRNTIKDIAKYRPEYVIVVMDNTWETARGDERPDFAAEFDQFRITEEIEPILTKELPEILGYNPKVVVWVKTAMGGAAFLPLNFDTVYFSSDGKMGGIGNLTELFGSTGTAIVREKQFSLRMGRARGMAVRGGYDTKIVTAMARVGYVLSYRIERGKAVLVEAMPNSDLGEFLLTDNGEGENADSVRALARGEGNDVLTLDAKIAGILGVSKGQVDELDDLLYELEIERSHKVIEGKSKRLMERWGGELVSAERSLRDLWKQVGEIQVQGEYRERQAARARQMQIITKIILILEKYDEVYKVRLLKIPDGLPPVTQLEIMHEQLRQDQMKDRP